MQSEATAAQLGVDAPVRDQPYPPFGTKDTIADQARSVSSGLGFRRPCFPPRRPRTPLPKGRARYLLAGQDARRLREAWVTATARASEKSFVSDLRGLSARRLPSVRR